MSYYQRSKYQVSNHAILRARQRIPGLKYLDEVMVRGKILEMIDRISSYEFTDGHCDYYHIPNQKCPYLYFVVNKHNQLIMTISPISFEKKFQLLNH